MYRLEPELRNPEVAATCANCGHSERAGNCEPIARPELRLTAGDPLPAGECTVCGSLSYIEVTA